MVTYNAAMDVEQVFKALADHHRRHLLDVLSQEDGQSLNQLCTHLPMSRIGVMKHLRILEEAGLITTRKVGRERLHYLNPSPIRGVVEWAEQYRRHWDARMDRLEEYLQELQQQQAVTPEREAVEPQPTQSKEVTDDDSE
jgi:DNA-binding transcriptional ArsR family regulator